MTGIVIVATLTLITVIDKPIMVTETITNTVTAGTVDNVVVVIHYRRTINTVRHTIGDKRRIFHHTAHS